MIIAFAGYKGSGKTTAASYVAHKYGYKQCAFARPLKDVLELVFRLSIEQMHDPVLKETVDPRWGKTPRELMQRIATDVVREIDADVWVKALMFRIQESDGRDFVIEDCRFENEVEAIRAAGGIVVRIYREEVVPDRVLHPSEFPVKSDRIIHNDGDVSNLHSKLDDLMASLCTEE